MKLALEEFKQHEVYFGTRSDAKFNEKHNMWYGVCSLLVMATIDVPQLGKSLQTPLLPGSRMTHDQVQQTIFGGQSNLFTNGSNASSSCGGQQIDHHRVGSAAQKALIAQHRHRVQLFPDGSGPRRFDV